MMSQITKPKSQCLWVCVIVVTWYFDVVQQIVLIFKRASNLSKPVVCKCWSNQEMACGWNTHPRAWCILRERTENTQWCGTHISMATYTYTTLQRFNFLHSHAHAQVLYGLYVLSFVLVWWRPLLQGKAPQRKAHVSVTIASLLREGAQQCSLSEEGLHNPRRGPCFHLVPLGFIKDLQLF